MPRILAPRSKLLIVLGYIGIIHLLIQTFLRIYIYFNPFTSYFAFVNVFSTYCYFSDETTRKWDPNGFQKVVKQTEMDFEGYQTLYSGNTFYAPRHEPARSLFSFERSLIQPLIEASFKHHRFLLTTSEVSDIIAEPFNGFGNLYHLLVQRGDQLIQVSTFLPISNPEFLPLHVSSTHQQVKLIVAYSSHVERFKTFLTFLRFIMNIDLNINVVVVNFPKDPSLELSETSNLKGLIREILGNPGLVDRVEFLSLIGKFSRGRGLNYGAEHSRKCTNCTLFFSDIDVTFTAETLNRCRLLAQPRNSVYFPMVFSQFNPALSKIQVSKLKLEINESSGIWRNFGYGMSCIHVKDFHRDGILFPEYIKWGGEDDFFHKKVRESGLLVYRITDPGLIHAYHSKNCSQATSKFACFKSKAIVEGNSIQLGTELFQLDEKLKNARKERETTT